MGDLYTCIVSGLILHCLFLLFRYNSYLASYRVYRRNYEHQPDFTNPPSFLKEYETQVCHIYQIC